MRPSHGLLAELFEAWVFFFLCWDGIGGVLDSASVFLRASSWSRAGAEMSNLTPSRPLRRFAAADNLGGIFANASPICLEEALLRRSLLHLNLVQGVLALLCRRGPCQAVLRFKVVKVLIGETEELLDVLLNREVALGG